MMVYIDLLLIKIYKYPTLKKHFLKNYMEKSLYLCGQIRESIEKDIASNLDGPQGISTSLMLGWSL